MPPSTRQQNWVCLGHFDFGFVSGFELRVSTFPAAAGPDWLCLTRRVPPSRWSGAKLGLFDTAVFRPVGTAEIGFVCRRAHTNYASPWPRRAPGSRSVSGPASRRVAYAGPGQASFVCLTCSLGGRRGISPPRARPGGLVGLSAADLTDPTATPPAAAFHIL